MNPDTLLHRQVHPSFIQNNTVSTQVFIQTDIDKDIQKSGSSNPEVKSMEDHNTLAMVVTMATEKPSVTVASSAFTPMKKDGDQLSVYNGDKFSALKSFNHFVGSGYKSSGVLSLTRNECESVDPLSVAEDNVPFDGHAYIDFSKVSSKGQKVARAGLLRTKATERGWTYRPEDE